MTKKISKVDKEREEIASKLYSSLMTMLSNMRISILGMAEVLKHIRDKEYWKELDCDSFEAFVSTPEISLLPKTAERYIGMYEYWIVEKKKQVKELSEMDINKLSVLKNVKNPEKYFHDAKTLAWSDFRKKVNAEEHGIKAEDDYGKHTAEKVCPYWNKKNGQCRRDIESSPTVVSAPEPSGPIASYENKKQEAYRKKYFGKEKKSSKKDEDDLI